MYAQTLPESMAQERLLPWFSDILPFITVMQWRCARFRREFVAPSCLSGNARPVLYLDIFSALRGFHGFRGFRGPRAISIQWFHWVPWVPCNIHGFREIRAICDLWFLLAVLGSVGSVLFVATSPYESMAAVLILLGDSQRPKKGLHGIISGKNGGAEIWPGRRFGQTVHE